MASSTAAGVAMSGFKMSRNLRYLPLATSFSCWPPPHGLDKKRCSLMMMMMMMVRVDNHLYHMAFRRCSWVSKKRFCAFGSKRIAASIATQPRTYLDQFEDASPHSALDKDSSNLVDDTESVVSAPLPYQINCWKLWQQGGHSVQEIARMRNIKEATVFRYLFKCIENGYEIDWSELCIEAGFNLELGRAVIEGIKKATSKMTSLPFASEDIIARINSAWEIKKKSERGLGQIKRFCSPEVTYIHIQIFLLMLECGFSLEDVHSTLRFASLEQKESFEEVRNVGYGGMVEQRPLKKILLEQGFLQWLHEKDGASLVEIVTTFRDCDEAYLMRLLLTLEETNQIYRNKGLYSTTKIGNLGVSSY